jgi:hypothetical protein
MKEALGGKRSKRSSREGGESAGSADASVAVKGEMNQFIDLGGPLEDGKGLVR